MAWAGAVFFTLLVALSLGNLSPSVSLAGYNVQILEFAQLGPLAWVLLLFPRLYKCDLVKAMGVVLLAQAVPLIYGLLEYGANAALRDFANIYYMMMVLFGYAIGRHAVLSAENLLVGLSIAVVIFLSAYAGRIAGGVIDYETIAYNFRIPGLICFCSAVLALVGLGRPTGWRKWVILAGGLIYAGFILQMRTRAIYLGLATGASIVMIHATMYYVRQPRYLGRIVGRLFFGGIVVLILSALFSDSVSTVFAYAEQRSGLVLTASYYTDVTIAYRLEAWTLAWNEFLSSPFFGVGFGKYLILDPWLRHEYALYPSHMIHNGVLQILYSGGIVSMAANIYFWRKVRTTLSMNKAAIVVIPVLAFSLSLLVYVAFGATLFKAVEAIPLWMFVGLSVGEAERLTREHYSRPIIASPGMIFLEPGEANMQ